MESNHHNIIDEQFRRRLYDAETPPPAFVWQNVEQELKKRKRRRFFLWLFVFGVAASGIWLTLMPTQKSGRKYPNTALVPPASVPEKTSVPPVSGEKPSLRPETTAEAGKAAAFRSGGTFMAPRTTKTAAESMSAAKSIALARESVTAPVLPPDSPETADLAPAVSEAPEMPQAAPAPAMPTLLPGAEAPLAFQRPLALPQVKSFIRKRKDPKYCYDFAQNPNVWMVDAYIGPTFGRQTFRAADPDFDAYAQMRRNTEENGWAFNAGLRGSLLLGRHFIIRTGIQYEQVTTIFEHIDPNYVKYLVEITQTIVDNKPVVVIDTVGVEYGENYVKTYNRFGMIDVPLEIGGEMRRGRVGLSLHAGLSFNALFWKRGTALSSGGQPLSFTPGEKEAVEIYRTRTGLSAGGSAQLFVHLHPTLRVFAEPYFRKVLKPLTLEDQPVSQRYGNWGIKFGAAKILD